MGARWHMVFHKSEKRRAWNKPKVCIKPDISVKAFDAEEKKKQVIKHKRSLKVGEEAKTNRKFTDDFSSELI